MGDHEAAESEKKKAEKSEGGDSSPVSATGKREAAQSKIYRLFGRQQPVHKVLGGARAADVLLWRDKKVTAGVLGVGTAVWVLFELIQYHLLTLVGHLLILGLTLLFLWSHVSKFIKKSPPRIPDVVLPEDIVLGVANALRVEINKALFDLREIASGRDIKKFLAVIAGLWVISILGSWLNFLTLSYISFVLLHTVPVLYEKYDDQIDAIGEKAEAEIRKQYAVLHAKVLNKIPIGHKKAA